METAKAALAHYIVDAKASKFTVQAFATGILSAVGHNPTLGIRNFQRRRGVLSRGAPR